MGFEVVSLQVVLVAIAVVLTAAGFTGLLILDLQGGPTINSFTASISDTNGDGVVNPADNLAISCSASDQYGIRDIIVDQTYPAFESIPAGSGYFGGSPSGSPTTYTLIRDNTNTVLYTGLGRIGGVPGTYTFKCKVTNVNGTITESSVQSINVAGNCKTCNSPSSWGPCTKDVNNNYYYGRSNYYCNSTSTYECYSYTEVYACTPTPSPTPTSPSSSPTSGSPVCGDNICIPAESKYSCSRDCGYSNDRCNSGQGNGACESGEDQWNCWKDCGQGQSSPSCNVDPAPLKIESACKAAGCLWCAGENKCKASTGSSCASSTSSFCNENKVCDSGESQVTCSADCGVSQGYLDGCGTGKCGDGKCNINCNIQEDWANCYTDCPKSGTSSVPTSTPTTIKPSSTPITFTQPKPGLPIINILGLEKADAIAGETSNVFCEAADAEGLKEIKVTITPPTGQPSTKTSPVTEKTGKVSILSYKLASEGDYIIECKVTDSDNTIASDAQTVTIGKERPIFPISPPITATASRLTKEPEILASQILAIELLKKETPVDFEASADFIEKAGATKLTIEVLKDLIEKATVKMKALDTIPEEDEGQALTDLLPEQPVIKVMQFTPSEELSKSIKQATIEFTLTKEEMDASGLTTKDVVLARFDSGIWTELETEFVEGTEFSFKAISPGFSVFVVTKRSSSITPQPTEPTETTQPSEEIPSAKPKVSLSCEENEDCEWYAANGCTEDTGAIWRCGNKKSSESLADKLASTQSCVGDYSAKPKDEACGCVKKTCKRVDAQSKEEATLIKSDLLDALLTIEQFKLRFEHLAKTSNKIASYHKGKDEETYSTWTEVTNSFLEWGEALESIRQKIKSVKDNPTKEDIDKITKDIDTVVRLLDNTAKKVMRRLI